MRQRAAVAGRIAAHAAESKLFDERVKRIISAGHRLLFP
jgi:hypothetical protein